MLSSKKRRVVIGPHVAEPTGEDVRCHRNHREVGRFPQYECKYCGVSGTLPEDFGGLFEWKKSCEGFEWVDGEQLAYENRD